MRTQRDGSTLVGIIDEQDHIRPLRDYVWLEALADEVKVQRGVLLPERAQQPSGLARVKALGPDAGEKGVAVDDVVMLSPTARAGIIAQRWDQDGCHLIVRIEDVAAVVKKAGAG